MIQDPWFIRAYPLLALMLFAVIVVSSAITSAHKVARGCTFDGVSSRLTKGE